MRKSLLVLTLLIASSGYSFAQGWRGFSLGADRDTLMYIIASPFDNWYINASAGIQTFIGNAPDSKAAWNKLDFGFRAELGKWVIPDIAVSLRLGFSTAHSQSRHGGNNPLTDINNPINYDGAEYGPYYPISASLFSLMGIVTIDWTNFFLGYEAGKRKRFHFHTPVGLGLTAMVGKVINQNYVNKPDVDAEIGDLSRNFELGFTGGVTAEYYATEHLALNATLELMWARGSLDDYNYNLDADIRRTDLIPSLYLGAKFNLLKTITKRDPYTYQSSKSKVNHEFLSYGTRYTIENLNGKIERLYHERDSIQDLAGIRANDDAARIADIDHQLDSLQNELDKLGNDNPRWGNGPRNIFDELLAANEILNLPAAIVYYQLDKYDLDYNACKRLEEFSREARHLDDTIEYYIIGAADSLTGSIRHNQWLSERRSDAAYNMLVDNYGMSGNQFIKVFAGGINVYDPQENNRMAMVIQRTPVTEEIVERWERLSRERLKKK